MAINNIKAPSLPSIGSLNRQVLLRKRVDMPSFSSGVDVSYKEEFKTSAKLTAVGMSTYYGSAQIGDKITHRAVIRTPKVRLDGTWELVYKNHRSGLEERYLVKRCADIGGQNRFLLIDLEEAEYVQSERPYRGF